MDAGSVCTTFVCDYVSTQFDPAHLLSELGFTVVFELVQLFLWVRLLRPRLHRRFDREHGIEHSVLLQTE